MWHDILASELITSPPQTNVINNHVTSHKLNHKSNTKYDVNHTGIPRLGNWCTHRILAANGYPSASIASSDGQLPKAWRHPARSKYFFEKNKPIKNYKDAVANTQ